jgi:hypothetical protein
MSKGLGLLIAATTVVFGLMGCGGGGNGNAGAVTRLVVGFVYVEGTAGSGTGNDVIISPSNVPPTGYVAPDATGSVTISVADGTISRAPDSEVFNMSDGNVIAATVTQNSAPFNMTINASGLFRNGISKSFGGAQSVSLGTTANNGTTLALNVNNAGVYTPGPTATIQAWLRNRQGNPGTSAEIFKAPEAATGGEWIGGNTYDVNVAFFDADGTAKSGITPSVVSDDVTRVTYAANLLTAATAQTAATVTLTIGEAVGAAVELTYDADYTQGTVANVFVSGSNPTLTWLEVGAVANFGMGATVTNQYGAPLSGITVDWRCTEADAGDTGVFVNTGTNTWNTPSAGAVFSGAFAPTSAVGQTAAIISPPISVVGPLAAGDKQPKGVSNVQAFVGAVNSNTIVVTIVRPLSSVSIVGPTRVDVGTTTSSNVLNSQNIHITGGVDVDNDAVATPAGPFVWSVINVDNSASQIGDNGDLTTQSTSASSISGSATGSSIQLAAGAVAGTVTVQVTGSGAGALPVPSNMLTIGIFGNPSKLIYRADDSSGAQIVNGAGAFAGTNGTVFNFTTRFLDSAGHEIPLGELGLTNKLGSTDSLSGANIVFGALPARTFGLTLGSADGTTTITFSGNWFGAQGGSGSFNINRTTALDVP